MSEPEHLVILVWTGLVIVGALTVTVRAIKRRRRMEYISDPLPMWEDDPRLSQMEAQMTDPAFERTENLAWRCGYFAKQSADEARYLTYWAGRINWNNAYPTHAEEAISKAERKLEDALAVLRSERQRLQAMRAPIAAE